MPLPWLAEVTSVSTSFWYLGMGRTKVFRTELRPRMLGSKPAPDTSFPISRQTITSAWGNRMQGMFSRAFTTSSFSRGIRPAAGTASTWQVWS